MQDEHKPDKLIFIDADTGWLPGTVTMLAKSPLRSKPYVAGAMKTLGFVEERPTANGACAIVLTPKAITQMQNLKQFL